MGWVAISVCSYIYPRGLIENVSPLYHTSWNDFFLSSRDIHWQFWHRVKTNMSCVQEIWHFLDYSPSILQIIKPNVRKVWYLALSCTGLVKNSQGNFRFHVYRTDGKFRSVSCNTDVIQWMAQNQSLKAVSLLLLSPNWLKKLVKLCNWISSYAVWLS